MLKLENKIKLDEDAIKASNLTDRLTAKDLETLGEWCADGFTRDKQSRFKWERRNEAAMDLAMQIQKDKSFPWPGCANIAFPLVTIATLQYHARAYPAIIQGNYPVKMRVVGEDSTGQKTQRANRVSNHMSYQVLEEDQSWEEQHDRLLINQPTVGTAFTKDRYSPKQGIPVTELVLARDLVLDYWTKSLHDCPRKTHIIPIYRNEIHEAIKRKTFRDVTAEDWYKEEARPIDDAHAQQQASRAGGQAPQPDETTPFTSLEQHVLVDLDGDGYAEPYIITFEHASKCILRIVTGFDRPEDIERTRTKEIINIRQLQYFTKYGFIPSPDGGIMDLGFGVLLGPLNESVNSILNQLVDAGTQAATAGGFLGRGAKLRGGNYTFAPFTWQRVDASGDDLRKSIFPLPVRDPSPVLFQLLNFLVTYANRLTGSTDLMVGETPGQNTPAETSRTAMVQGEKIYNAIYKRTWRSMKEEFKKRYILNGIYLPFKHYYGDKGGFAMREDYTKNPDHICPAADPHLASESEALQQAMALKQFAMSTAGYDHIAVEHRVLRAMKIDAIEEVYPGPKSKRASQNIHPKVQIEQLRQSTKMKELEQNRLEFVAEMQEQIRVNSAEIMKLQAEVVKLLSDVQVDKANVQISALNAQVAAFKARNEHLLQSVDRVLQMIELDKGEGDGGNATRDKGGEGAPAAGGTPSGLVGTPANTGAAADSGGLA